MAKTGKYKVVWTETAKNDLVGIINYIANDNPSIARKVRDKIKQKTQKLKSFPLRGKWVPELKNVGIFIYHELIEKPWRIIYRVEQKTVFIIGILDSRRELEVILLERLFG